ncbi:hypothetical protein L1987_24132 [Smallanthus sonchifolius]|uniref:Uncharacterized protein n=1 Tax=Smallanthus sonchifolius TaxID=185202 RepID=A0ACB9IJM0_9ASTR|nr:hypothetical protein L1987_24132 [Smallanthus sonchifolius]
MARAFTNEFNLLANTEPVWKGAALQYRDIVDFLNRSRISYAIFADPIVSRPYLEQFWETAEHDCTQPWSAFLSTRATTSPATSLRPSMTRSTQRRGERLQVKRVDKRVFAQFLKSGSVDPTPVYTELFGHLINEAYVALDDEGGNEGTEGSDSEATESDSSDSDDAPSQVHPRRMAKVTLPESSSKRKRQSSSSEYEPDSDSDAAIERQRRESIHKNRDDKQQPSIPSVVEAQQQLQVSAARQDSASTPSSHQLYPEIPVIVTIPTTTVQVAVTAPVLTESVTITPTITPTTLVTSSIPTTTIEPPSQPFNYGDFTQGFDFDTIFSSPIHNVEASSSRHPDPNDSRIDNNSLVDEVKILRSQRTGTEERLKNVLAQNELLIKTNEMLLGEKDKEKEKKKEKRTTGDEACHPVDLTKDDDKDKDPEAGPSGGEHQALAIVPISVVPMAQGESTHQEGGDTSGGGGGDKGKSVAEVLKDLSDNEILYLEPDYSKEAQIDALFNLEEGEIDYGDDWDDDDDEDVVIEIPKGDGEGEYELEDGEIFEFLSFDAPLNTGSVEQASNVEASTEASPVDPEPVDPEAPKETNMPSTSSKGPAPVWQKTSIIDKHEATGMILAVSSLPKYDLVNLANRELLGHSNHVVAMGLSVVRQREARSEKFEMFKPQVPKRVKDKHVINPVTKKHLKKLVYKPVRCENKIPLSKLSQDILGDM